LLDQWNIKDQIPLESVFCESQKIYAQYENKQYPLVLFNMELKDEAVDRACEIIHQGEEFILEIDDVYRENELTGWLYIDSLLLQQQLADENIAVFSRNNPYYLHQKEQTEPVVSYPDIMVFDFDRNRGVLLLIFLLILFIALLWLMIRKKVLKHFT